MNQHARKLSRSALRIAAALALILSVAFLVYLTWQPGLDIRDGRHDRGSNGIWLAHGWLGANDWFETNHKTQEYSRYRDPSRVQALAKKLERHHVVDVYPHLCPADPITGRLPAVEDSQVDYFLQTFHNFRVMPWIGGPNGSNIRAHDPKWRTQFGFSVGELFRRHPAFAGVHLNVEPMPSGNRDFILLLDELKNVLPRGKILSLAAYPPPTRWHPFPDVHWDEGYFREIARHCDQLTVMMYDAAQKDRKAYQALMRDWTTEVLEWSDGKEVLLGIPTYADAGVEYHSPAVENLTNALFGIHRALSKQSVPAHYQGVAIYCEWETSDAEWDYFDAHFLKPPVVENAGP